MRPAVFLDRDGTLIEERGYIGDPAQAVFLPQTFSALAALQKHFLLVIVTNQSGVGKGLIRRDDVDRVNRFVADELRRRGIVLTDTLVCPHAREEECPCHKPSPHLALRAAERYGIDLARSYAVGDHPHDVEFADNFGGTGIYVLTGHGEKHRAALRPGAVVAADIGSAAEWILG